MQKRSEEFRERAGLSLNGIEFHTGLPENALSEDLISARLSLSTIPLMLGTEVWKLKESFLGTMICVEVIVLSASLMSCHLFKEFLCTFSATFHYSFFEYIL